MLTRAIADSIIVFSRGRRGKQTNLDDREIKMKTTNLTGGTVPNATRIDSCCWLDGEDDEIIVEFWYLSGSILRTQYNRRSTVATESFVPVASWEFGEMMKKVEGHFSQFTI